MNIQFSLWCRRTRCSKEHWYFCRGCKRIN
nr:MAG TPA: hypothetical protein [Ackermannviridae sp.]